MHCAVIFRTDYQNCLYFISTAEALVHQIRLIECFQDLQKTTVMIGSHCPSNLKRSFFSPKNSINYNNTVQNCAEDSSDYLSVVTLLV